MSAPENSDALRHLTLAPEAQNLLFLEARTANTFTDEPVTEDQVRAIYELVKYGPDLDEPAAAAHRPGALARRPASGWYRTWPSEPGEDRQRAAGRDPRRGHGLPRGAAQVPAVPGGAGHFFAEPACGRGRRGSTPRSRSATSSWASAPPGSRPGP